MKRIFLFCFVSYFALCGNINSSQIDSLKKTSQAFNHVALKAIPAVVNISTLKTIHPRNGQRYYQPFQNFFGDELFQPFYNDSNQGFQQKGLGSGVIVSKDGYILTNNHVVAGMDKITVTLSDKRQFQANVIGTDKKTDLALLKIDGDQFPVIQVGNSDHIQVGDWAIAVGSPFGLAGTVTIGIISAKGRSEQEIVDYSDLIQTDAAINPGNSGGALLNIDGELIGINTAIITRSGGYMGIGFAVPVNMAKRVMADLKEQGRVSRGWLGVFIQEIDQELREKLNLKNVGGALITDIVKDSPAEKAGLKRGDVVFKFNGRIISDFRALRVRVGEVAIGTLVPIELFRKGKKKVLYVEIVSNPKTARREKIAKLNKIGITVDQISSELIQKYNLSDHIGVVVTDVRLGSAAYHAGIRKGDVILEVNEKEVNSLRDYQRELKKIKKGQQVLLVVKSNHYARYIVVTAGH